MPDAAPKAGAAPLHGARWVSVTPQRKPVQGGADYPCVRYSATSVAYDGHLIVTHGYFYDHEHRHPAWQSDAWSFSFRDAKWTHIHDGEAAGAPSARYSASGVEFEHGLWFYGGDDGGHKYSMNNYVFGAHYDDLWRFDLRGNKWAQLQPPAPLPPKRALHSAVVVGGAMYVYGGLKRADLWAYDFGRNTWRMLIDEPSTSGAVHPGQRHAHGAAAGSRGFVVWGGVRHEIQPTGERRMKVHILDDLWWYSVDSNEWQPRTAVGAAPSARSYHSLVAITPHAFILYGGAFCQPGCDCFGDTWLLRTRGQSAEWTEVGASHAPIHRYRQSLVRDGSSASLYLFGGESYKPYMYHNAIDRLELPAELIEDSEPAEAAESAAALRAATLAVIGSKAATEAPRAADRPAERGEPAMDRVPMVAAERADPEVGVRAAVRAHGAPAVEVRTAPAAPIFAVLALLALVGFVARALMLRRRKISRSGYEAVASREVRPAAEADGSSPRARRVRFACSGS